MNPSIQSLGAPPERHADRVVAEMMQHLAQTRAHLWPAICEAIDSSSDGSPKAQRKMAGRIKRAGALDIVLAPGKRGRYLLTIYDWTGWDPFQDKEISLGDVIPERPWIACHVTVIESKGNGRRGMDLISRPILFITHHALSRTAQRLGARTTDHLQISCVAIWSAAMTLANELGIDRWLNAPAAGWRAPIETKREKAFVVLKRHETRNALLAATVMS